ncbi:MAG TPA: hypothetical protein VN853_05925 [Polyangia bacterium]|nr:hypothetical protein [Polyangia bacterium]
MASADLYLHRAGVLDAAACARWVAGVYAARADWTPCFEGVQFTLGRAYYTHLEEDRADEYFATARASDAIVERALPALQARVRGLLGELVGAPVTPRPGWCGPGVHIFPAGDWLSQNGGDVHFDTEGLREPERAARLPALSAILMLQPPRQGGGLRVWDALWDGRDEEDDLAATARAESAVVEYAAGDLVVIDSYRLHQIQPFSGDRDRLSVTAHLIFTDGRWQAWF